MVSDSFSVGPGRANKLLGRFDSYPPAFMTRKKRNKGGRYKIVHKPATDFFSTGCGLLNRVLGGGWVRGRMENIIGDFSTGKTLLAIEAVANFHKKWPDAPICYDETEAAFDRAYAENLGLPLDVVSFPSPKHNTIEEVYRALEEFCKGCDPKIGGLYVVDSWDALSDTAEMDKDIDKGSFGAAKAKKGSELFRKLTRLIEDHNVTLLIVSQTRDKIGIMFGDKVGRSGGKALDFYATHCLWLSQRGKIKEVRNRVERKVGVEVRCQCKKNKVCAPFRECDIPIIFYYGVDDVQAAINWLVEVGCGDEIGIKSTNAAATQHYKQLDKLSDEEFKVERVKLNKIVRHVWDEIENSFMPKRRKYA